MDWNQIWEKIKNFFVDNAWNIVWFFVVLVVGLIVIKIIMMTIKFVFRKKNLIKSRRSLSSRLSVSVYY